MLSRPILSLLDMLPSDPWIGEIIHFVTASMANIPIGFIYLELLILASPKSKRPSGQGALLAQRIFFAKFLQGNHGTNFTYCCM